MVFLRMGRDAPEYPLIIILEHLQQNRNLDLSLHGWMRVGAVGKIPATA
jgi:hypothetical protein